MFSLPNSHTLVTKNTLTILNFSFFVAKITYIHTVENMGTYVNLHGKWGLNIVIPVWTIICLCYMLPHVITCTSKNMNSPNTSNSQDILVLEYQESCEILSTTNFKEDSTGHLLNIQDAEYMHDPALITQVHCPAHCTALVNNHEITLVLDTGAGGGVVSRRYLETIDPQWETKLSALNVGTWKGYGSSHNQQGPIKLMLSLVTPGVILGVR